MKQTVKKSKFKVGDKVRISKFKMFLRKIIHQIGQLKYLQLVK